MSRVPVRVNHSVVAAVRVPRNFDWGECASIMRDEGWSVLGDQAKTVVALPLYCAKSVALRQARRQLQVFSQSRVPIVVDELRLLTPETDTRRIAAVRNIGGWAKMLPKRTRESSELLVDPVGWEVTIDRSRHDDVGERQKEEIETAEQKLKESVLPGKRFNRADMNIFTSAEPKNINVNPWDNPRSSVSFVLGLIAIFGLGAASSTIFWLGVLRPFLEDYFTSSVVNISTLVTCVAAVVAFASGAAGGYWATGNRVSVWTRLLGMFGSVFVFAGIGFVFSLQFDNFSRIVMSAGFLGVFLFLLLGWIHLCVLWPSVGALWSIPSLSLLVAGGSFLAQSSFSLWESEFGLPGESIQIPAWMRIVLSLIVILWICGCVFIIGAGVGWGAFLGMGASGVLSHLIIGFTAVLMLILLITSGVSLGLSKSTMLVNDWRDSLEDGEAPELTSSFLFRGCVSGEGLPSRSAVDFERPVAVIQGKESNIWVWDISDVEDLPTSVVEVVGSDIKVTRVADGVRSCDQ